VPITALGGLEGDAPAVTIIEAQDSEIAEPSGRPRSAIKTMSRVVGLRKAPDDQSSKPAAPALMVRQ
jgi:hypothetical protein